MEIPLSIHLWLGWEGFVTKRFRILISHKRYFPKAQGEAGVIVLAGVHSTLWLRHALKPWWNHSHQKASLQPSWSSDPMTFLGSSAADFNQGRFAPQKFDLGVKNVLSFRYPCPPQLVSMQENGNWHIRSHQKPVSGLKEDTGIPARGSYGIIWL